MGTQKVQHLHAPTRGYSSAQVSKRTTMKNFNIPRFRGKLPKGFVARSFASRSHYGAVDFKIMKLKNLKGKMEDNLNGQNWSSTLDYYY
jgi:hypothetical protein